MAVPSSRYDSYVFRLVPQQITACLGELSQKDIEKKYEREAALLLKWKRGSSGKGRALFSVDLTQCALDGAQRSGRNLSVLDLKHAHEIVFRVNMNRKAERRRGPQREAGGEGGLGPRYEKKEVLLKVRLLVCRRRTKGVQAVRARLAGKKGGSVRAVALGDCVADLRQLMPGDGGTQRRVRLPLRGDGEFVELDCLAERCDGGASSLSSLLPGVVVSVEGSDRSGATVSSSSLSTMSRLALEDELLSSNGSLRCAVLDEKEKNEKKEEGGGVGESMVVANTIGTENKNKNQEQEEVVIAVRQKKAKTTTMMKPTIVMASLPNASVAHIYDFCEASIQAVALFHKHGGGSRKKPPFLPLRQIIENGTSYDQHFAEGDPLKLFSLLFPKTPKEFALMPALHRNRHDTNYPDVQTWRDVPATQPHAAYFTAEYSARYQKTRFVPAEEYGIAVGACDRILVHMISIALKAPIVGGNAHLELLVEIVKGGRVRMVFFLCVPDKLRFLLRSRLASHEAKLKGLMKRTLHEIAVPISMSASLSRPPSSSFLSFPSPSSSSSATSLSSSLGEESTSSLSLSSSLDPNLWYRLRSADAVFNSSLIEAVLRRLQHVDLPPPRACDSVVQSLEEVVCLHRNHIAVIRFVLLSLFRIAAGQSGAAMMVNASPTLNATLQQVLAIHHVDDVLGPTTYKCGRDEITAPDVKEFMRALDEATQHWQDQRRRERSAVKDVWHLLDLNRHDRQITMEVIQRLQSMCLSYSESQCHLLHAALVLHMDSAPIAHGILRLLIENYRQNVSFKGDLSPLNADFILAICRAVTIHREAILHNSPESFVADCNAFTEALEERISTMSFFERHFEPLLREELLFTCRIHLLHTDLFFSNSSTMVLSITPSYLCFGSTALPLADLCKVQMYRYLWCFPAFSLFMQETSAPGEDSKCIICHREVAFICFQREELLSALKQAKTAIVVVT